MNDLTPQQQKDSLIQKLDEAREQMRKVLAHIDLHQEIYPTWTIKHVLAHLSGWDEACIATVEAFLKGDEYAAVASRGVDHYNKQSVDTRIEMDYDHIRREFEFTRTQYKSLIDRVPAERLNEVITLPWGDRAPLALLITAFTNHEAEHAVEIEDIVRKTDAERAAAEAEKADQQQDH